MGLKISRCRQSRVFLGCKMYVPNVQRPSVAAFTHRPVFPARPPFAGKAWRKCSSGPVAEQRRELISPHATRRQALLLGASPVWCCAACNRNTAMDRLFAQSMATGMLEYEAAIAPLKRMLFSQLADGLRPVPASPARILEIGIGTGPNLKYYPNNSGIQVTGVDPNPFMLPFLRETAAGLSWPQGQLDWVEGAAESLPLPDASVDAVVCTLVLCSVADVPSVMQEVRRVLRPGGSFLFIEHTIAQGRPLLQLGQRVLDPLQQLLADGCHLTRDPLPSIQAAGFSSVDAQRLEVDGMGLIGPHVAGIATM